MRVCGDQYGTLCRLEESEDYIVDMEQRSPPTHHQVQHGGVPTDLVVYFALLSLYLTRSQAKSPEYLRHLHAFSSIFSSSSLWSSIFHLSRGSHLSGITSACLAGFITNPLDVAKTRLQVICQHLFSFGAHEQVEKRTATSGSPPNIVTTLVSLYRSEGVVRLWTKGLTARLGLMMFSSLLLSSSYEGLKYLALKE